MRGYSTAARAVVVALSVGTPRVWGATYSAEVNMTSRGAGLTVDTAPPVQYIHIPKAGGTTVQASMKSAVARWSRKLKIDNSMALRGCRENKNMGLGQYYAGHVSIGYFSTTFRAMSPIYVLVTREPIALMISLYDYMGTYTITRRTLPEFQEEVRQRNALEANLTARGIPEPAFLDHLLRHGLMRLIDYKAFYVPCDCELADDDKQAETATLVAMHNLLRVDVVAVLEDFATLKPQLEFHLPWLTPVHFNHARNAAARPSQELSQDTLDALKTTERYTTQKRLYDFATRVARARAAFVQQCRDHRCPPDLVPIQLDPDDFNDLLTSRDVLRERSCLVPPPDGQGWPRLVAA